MHLYIFSLIYIFYGYGSVNVDHFVENFILSFYRSFFRKYWLQFDLLSDNGYIYIYIYIYINLSVNVIDYPILEAEIARARRRFSTLC